MVEIFYLFVKLFHQADHKKTLKERTYRMDLLKKLFISVLIVLTLNLYLPGTALAQQLHAKADVPKHSPESWSSPEIKITKTKEEPKKKGKKWVYILLGVLVVGGAAAAAGGGGGDGGGVGRGDYSFSW